VAFSSPSAGGQSEEEATAHLAAMNQVEGVNKPWTLSFSFGRALQVQQQLGIQSLSIANQAPQNIHALFR
jgi:fructose-bisphosphate aldolase class 1